MQQRDAVSWARLGLVEKAFLVSIALFAVIYFSGVFPFLQVPLALVTIALAIATLVQLARYSFRNVIWRLRNRLIVAYLFIAVVPVVLILALIAGTAYLVVGQMAIYLINTELNNHMRVLTFPANAMVRNPMRDSQAASNQVLSTVRRYFPEFELLATGESPMRFPPDSKLEAPPATWKTAAGWPNANGLVLKRVNDHDRLFAWAHAEQNGNEVTIIAPITPEVLSNLVPGIGDVIFLGGYTPRSGQRRLPAQMNALDLQITFPSPVDVPNWSAPDRAPERIYLLVATRFSAVLSIIFGLKADWTDALLTSLLLTIVVFFLAEIAALYAGIRVTRSITGAVHELYEGTDRVQHGDFSYRISVKGTDQLAELGESFNAMTQNLGRLIVVAKEKERLESELAIAREVQNQLFPKSAPSLKTLQLSGVCNPARMVSGDYYDYMNLPDGFLGFAIGDVAGKGISAALLMATIQSTMRTQLGAVHRNGNHGYSAAEIVATLNRQLYATTSPEKYATFFFALYNEVTNALTYTNAGHLAPLLLRGHDFQLLDSTGTVVGAFPVARYEEKSIIMEPGDLLVTYTDGIVEPENVYGEQFGEERLKEIMIKYAKADSGELIARTMESVVQWTGAGELQDDMTMLVARRV